MSQIPFIQYLRPKGTKQAVLIERPENIAQAASRIMEHGFHFECEVLTTGEVSLTIVHKDTDHAIEICANGPAVPLAVDKLIGEFNLAHALKELSHA